MGRKEFLVLPRLTSFVNALFALVLFGCVESSAPTAGDWTTPWAEKLGVKLKTSFDSSGPPAWDSNKHSAVFIATEGLGYGGVFGRGRNQGKLPGLAIFDAVSRDVVTSANYDVLSWGWKDAFEPHGLGVSPEGDWIYLPTGEGSIKRKGDGRLLIINAKTLKVDKVLELQSQPHLIKAFRDADGKALVLVESFNSELQPAFILDPANDNKVVGGWDKDPLGGLRSNINFINPNGKEVFVSAGGPQSSKSKDGETSGTTIVRIDTKTWNAKGSFQIPAIIPLWIAFSADNNYAYINDSHGNTVFQYDRAADKVISQARSGVERPYGTHLGWDDRHLYSVGTGERSRKHNRALGVLDTTLMGETNGASPGQFSIDCVGSHATLHPDPEANEFWITCGTGADIVVFDIDQRKVTARLRMPNGGSTHPGAFVNYQGLKGEVTSDLNGLQGSALTKKRQLLGLTH